MSLNFAARAGRWSATHRKAAILGWIAFVLIAMGAGTALGTREADDADLGVGESGRAERVLGAGFPTRPQEMVLVQGTSGRGAAVEELERRLGDLPVIASVGPTQESADGRSALVNVTFETTDADVAEEQIGAVESVTAAVQRAHPGLRVEQFGDVTGAMAIGEAFEKDFKKAEILSLPVTAVILLVAFGTLMAAGLPLLLALSAVMATLGVLAVVSQVMPMDDTVASVVLLVGLAVGVDYSLFYLRREREERAAGQSHEAALLAAAATSGRAVLVSGLTVIIAMAGMYLAGAATFSGLATGAIAVVAIALVASLTVLPALLSKLGDRVEKGRIPVIGRRRRTGESRAWNAVLDRVLRRPKLAAVLSAGLLLAVALPALGMKTAIPGFDAMSRDIPAVQTYDRIQAAFPGEASPAVAVVAGEDVTKGELAGRIETLAQRTGATVDVSPDRTVATIAVPLPGNGTDDASTAAVVRLREEAIPAAGLQADVTGFTASTKDFNDVMRDRAPLVFAFVLGLAFLLLLVTFRSIVIPIKAIALNLLSVGASYGVLTLVFQHGWFESVLGFESSGAVTSWLPMFLFVILFGLSMDYHVFVLTRIREGVDRGMRTEDAVAHGIKTTAGVITSAAAVMIGVFAIFGTLSALEFKQMGVGLAVAILIDATIVRAVLLPATMKLLGEWNWWLPRRLEWLPKVEPEGARA